MSRRRYGRVGKTFNPKHIIPWIIIAVGVWVMISVPGEGMEAWISVDDQGFTSRAIGASATVTEAHYTYYNDSATSSLIGVGLSVSGTSQDHEILFPNPAAIVDYHASKASFLQIHTNYTVNELLADLDSRLVVSVDFANLGVVNPNVTSIYIKSYNGLSQTDFHYVAFSGETEIQINSTTEFTYSLTWNIAKLTTFAASHGTEGVSIQLNFDAEAKWVSSELWAVSLLFQAYEVSKAQTWVACIFTSTGFAIGTFFLLPQAGLMDNPLEKGKKRKSRVSRGQMAAAARRAYYQGLRRGRRRRRYP